MTRVEILRAAAKKFEDSRAVPKVYPKVDTVGIRKFWEGRSKLVLEWRKKNK
jgi:hypothetical protein